MILVAQASAQEKKLERLRAGGGSASGTQLTMWLAKEGNYYEKHGLEVEAISIPGSSLALQAMLAGELQILQLGGAASIQANFGGADTVIIATIVRKFLFWIYGRPEIGKMEDLKARFLAQPVSEPSPISPPVSLYGFTVSILSAISR
jgi:ABC-type nitrate/sulfonate/bicarbonate transport system substrate-binding protein